MEIEFGRVYNWYYTPDNPRGYYVIPARLEGGSEFYFSITAIKLMKVATKKYWTELLSCGRFYDIDVWNTEFDEDDILWPVLDNSTDRIDSKVLTDIIFEQTKLLNKLVSIFGATTEQIKVDNGD